MKASEATGSGAASSSAAASSAPTATTGGSLSAASGAPSAAGDLPKSLQETHDDDKKELANLLDKASEWNTGAMEGTGSGLSDSDLPSAFARAIKNDALKREGVTEWDDPGYVIQFSS